MSLCYLNFTALVSAVSLFICSVGTEAESVMGFEVLCDHSSFMVMYNLVVFGRWCTIWLAAKSSLKKTLGLIFLLREPAYWSITMLFMMRTALHVMTFSLWSSNSPNCKFQIYTWICCDSHKHATLTRLVPLVLVNAAVIIRWFHKYLWVSFLIWYHLEFWVFFFCEILLHWFMSTPGLMFLLWFHIGINGTMTYFPVSGLCKYYVGLF